MKKKMSYFLFIYLFVTLGINFVISQTSSKYVASKKLSTAVWDQKANNSLQQQAANVIDCLEKCQRSNTLSET